MSVQFGTNISVAKKRVKFYNRESSAVTIYEGMPVCYIFDTTANVLGYDKGAGGDPKSQSTPDTTAEGYQNEGKFLIVETVNDDNHLWFAGVTTGAKNGKSVAATSYEWIEIYEPNGAIVPVRVDVYTTVGVTILALEHDSQALTQPLSTSEGRPVAIAEEDGTYSSGTPGLVLARLCPNEFIYQDSNGTALSAVGSDGGTSDVVVNRINLTTAQTAGKFTALDIRATIESTASSQSGGCGYGLALYAQADINGVLSGSQNAGVAFWTNINAGGDLTTQYFGLEVGIYEGGADLSGCGFIAPLCLRMQIDGTSGPTAKRQYQMYLRSEGGGSDPDGLFAAYTLNSIGMTAKTSAAVSHIIPIEIEHGSGTGTYYIMVSNAA